MATKNSYQEKRKAKLSLVDRIYYQTPNRRLYIQAFHFKIYFQPPARLKSDCDCSDSSYVDATSSAVSAPCPSNPVLHCYGMFCSEGITLRCSYCKRGWHCQSAKEGVVVGVTACWMLGW